MNKLIIIVLNSSSVYTAEDLKWHAPKGRHYKSLVVSDP